MAHRPDGLEHQHRINPLHGHPATQQDDHSRNETHAPPGRVDTELALRAARSECTLLITGETGVGKGFLARWLHQQSGRHDGPYIPVNCGAIPESIIDSQLFGHARGSFSGAVADHIGLVRAAENGTLMLDEISELPHSAQLRLLRLLQDREVQPVGYPKPVLVDVRVMAATNIDLQKAVEEKAFREDLFFRLDVIQINVPPLRDRAEQIPGFIEAFNGEFSELYKQPPLTFDEGARQLALAYHWPGNIRELRTVVERLHVLCPGATVTPEMLSTIGKLQLPDASGDLQRHLDGVRIEQVHRVLAETGGSVSRTAEAFGVHRSTIYRWLRKSNANSNKHSG